MWRYKVNVGPFLILRLKNVGMESESENVVPFSYWSMIFQNSILYHFNF